MKGYGLWMSGLLLLLMGLCAYEFRQLHKGQKEFARQWQQWRETSDQGSPRVMAKPAAQDQGMAELTLELQNFMRDVRSRQTALEKRLADLDERINHERETILQDLKAFLDDMRREKEEFGREVDRVQGSMGAGDAPQWREMKESLDKLQEKIEHLTDLVEQSKKQQEEIYQEENEGIRVEGKMTGPGERTTY